MDTLILRQIRIETLIGVYQWEREQKQTVLVDLYIRLPEQTTPYTDDIEQTIDYAKLVLDLRQWASEQNWQLLETLAENMASWLFTNYLTPYIKIKVSKPAILEGVAEVAIELERESPTK